MRDSYLEMKLKEPNDGFDEEVGRESGGDVVMVKMETVELGAKSQLDIKSLLKFKVSKLLRIYVAKLNRLFGMDTSVDSYTVKFEGLEVSPDDQLGQLGMYETARLTLSSPQVANHLMEAEVQQQQKQLAKQLDKVEKEMRNRRDSSFAPAHASNPSALVVRLCSKDFPELRFSIAKVTNKRMNG